MSRLVARKVALGMKLGKDKNNDYAKSQINYDIFRRYPVKATLSSVKSSMFLRPFYNAAFSLLSRTLNCQMQTSAYRSLSILSKIRFLRFTVVSPESYFPIEFLAILGIPEEP